MEKLFWMILSAVILNSMCAVAIWAGEDFQTSFSEGLKLNDQNKLQEAIPYFEKTIQLKPDFARAYFELAYDYDYLEQKDKAIELYEKGLKYDPKFFAAYLRLALCYTQVKGDLGKARFYVKEALKIIPDDPAAISMLKTIEDKIRSMPAGTEILKNEKKYAKKGVGVYQNGNYTYVGPLKNESASTK